MGGFVGCEAMLAGALWRGEYRRGSLPGPGLHRPEDPAAQSGGGGVVDLLGEPARDRRFSDGAGMFYDQEQYEGRDVTVRSGWFDITATAARREQAFSEDGGQTWETSLTADFTRTD
jgi:hypothetical protein